MYCKSALPRSNYLTIRNNYLKNYIFKSFLLKKPTNYISNKIYDIYNNYLNYYHLYIYKYYTLTDEDWLLIESLTLVC